MKKQVRQKQPQFSTPVAIVIVVVVIVLLGILGKVFLRPRMPAAPPELQGRSREAPTGGMMKGGGMLKSGQATSGTVPSKAPD